MAKNRTIRFAGPLDELVDQYTEKNGLKLNQLVSMAVKKFISEPNTIELEPIEAKNEDWDKAMKSAFKKNKKAMDELA